MDKREACHKLADINEKIYDLKNSLADIESRLVWDDESKRDWYLERKEKCISELEEAKQEHDNFMREYGDIINS